MANNGQFRNRIVVSTKIEVTTDYYGAVSSATTVNFYDMVTGFTFINTTGGSITYSAITLSDFASLTNAEYSERRDAFLTFVDIIGGNRSTLIATSNGVDTIHCPITTTTTTTSTSTTTTTTTTTTTMVPIIFWIGGNNGVLNNTLNGGITWNDKTTPTITGLLTDLDFVNSTGYVYSNNTVYKTVDGINWVLLTSSLSLQCVYALTENIILGGTYITNPAYYRSIDGGATWTPISKGGAISMTKFMFIDLSVGYALNAVPVIGGGLVLMKTIDGGDTWTNITAPTMNTSYSYYDISFYQNTGYIAAGDHIFKSIDGGTTWTAPINPPYSSFYIYATRAFASGVVIVAGTDPAFTAIRICRSTDGGNTWAVISKAGVYSGGFNGDTLSFIDDNHGVLAVHGNLALYTANNGLNWFSSPTTTSGNNVAAQKLPLQVSTTTTTTTTTSTTSTTTLPPTATITLRIEISGPTSGNAWRGVFTSSVESKSLLVTGQPGGNFTTMTMQVLASGEAINVKSGKVGSPFAAHAGAVETTTSNAFYSQSTFVSAQNVGFPFTNVNVSPALTGGDTATITVIE